MLKIPTLLSVVLALLEFGCATHRPPPTAAAPGPPPVRTAVEPPPAVETPAPATVERPAPRRVQPPAPALGSESPSRLARALELHALGDFDGAADELRAALRERPDLTQARLHLAAALMARRDWPAARRELEDALSRQPDLAQAHYSLGLVRYALRDVNGSIAEYRHVLDREPANADARYNLALMLKLAGRDAESTPEFLAAAEAGLPRAQYFLASAYATGAGVERDLAAAIAWYFRAADAGVPQAAEALAQLRQAADGRARRADRRGVEQAFRQYRDTLWRRYPELTRSGDETIGAALVREGRAGDAVPVLIREAAAMSEEAQRLLEAAYERERDARILEYFKTAAAEGRARPRRFLQEHAGSAR